MSKLLPLPKRVYFDKREHHGVTEEIQEAAGSEPWQW